MVSGFNMKDPDEVVLVLLDVILEGAVFYMTDRPWNGTGFVDGENDGVLKWTFDTSVPRGAEICHRCTQDGSVVDNFEAAEKNFLLDSNGDTIILYCMTDPENGTSAIRHVSAITNNGRWETNATQLEGHLSVLPDSLPDDAVTTLELFSNYEYDGPMVGTANLVKSGLSNSSYWDGQEDYIDNLQTKSSFKIVDEASSGASILLRSSTWMLMSVALLLWQ